MSGKLCLTDLSDGTMDVGCWIFSLSDKCADKKMCREMN